MHKMGCIYAYVKKDTNKIKYIGQTIHLRKRHVEHIGYDLHNPNAPMYNSILSKGFRKYGIDAFALKVIEYCDIQKLDEREKFWIAYYDTYNNGYNATLGGQGTQGQYKYDKDIIYDICLDLKNTTKTISDIAVEYNVSQSFICLINQGETRVQEITQEGFVFPIRDRINDIQQKQSEDIIRDILTTSLSLTEISNKYCVPYEYVRKINKGNIRHNKKLKYPLRQVKRNNLLDSPEIVEQIIEDLINSQLTQKDIAKKYNISQTSVINIKFGRTHYHPSLKYPLR